MRPICRRLLPRPFLALGAFLLVAATAAGQGSGQAANPASGSASPQTQDPASPAQQSHGQVIFSRSTEENGEENGQTVTIAPSGEMPPDAAPVATDAERQAVTFTGFDMDVHLRAADQHFAVRALVTVRNDGTAPLNRIPVQISSSLNWDQIRVGAHPVVFSVATLNSDADHTGQLHEAAVPLSQPLAAGQSLQLDLNYSGSIPASAQRLIVIGTPDAVALHSDWDSIGEDFTGLRGFGNVVWYPVSSVPVILGDGARLFDEIGEQKLRLSGARFRLRLTDEFPRGHEPTVALVNGQPVELTVTASQNDEVPGVATASIEDSTLGFEAPSLFVAVRTSVQATDATLWTLAADQAASQSWIEAAKTVTPFLQSWLGEKPRTQLAILDLPDPEDASYETCSLLVTPVRQAAADQLQGVLAHALTHAWIASPRAWLSEGVAHFMGTLWIEKQNGRTKALESLAASRAALALAEPPSPGENPGQPLAQAISPVYYRTKAAYVFWMLRDLAGDEALSAALRAYDPSQDQSKGSGKDLAPSSFEKLIEAGAHRDLAWFFADWVDADKGLPDLAIDSVYPTAADAGSWLVAVNVSNSGYAAAEVPITVRTATTSVVQRVLIPARGQAVERILVLGKPTEVQLNDGTVPETEASIHVTRLNASAASPEPAPASTPQ
jgi:hypothetical protein